MTTLRNLLPDDGIVTTDAGSFGTWAPVGSASAARGRSSAPTSGAMGYGLPAAIAAGLVHRDRAVVALVGDGGLGMTLAEVETARPAGLRTIVLVFDNQRYGMIRTYQDRREGASAPATDLGPIDFAAAGRALGARGVRVEDDAAFEPALRQALSRIGPTRLIHLVVDRRWEGVDGRARSEFRDPYAVLGVLGALRCDNSGRLRSPRPNGPSRPGRLPRASTSCAR